MSQGRLFGFAAKMFKNEEMPISCR